jgi:hypothetical protein
MFKRVQLDLGEYKPKLLAPGVGIWKYDSKLPLTTDGHLRIIFLGVGAAFSTQMFQANIIIVKGKTALFVDLGTKATLKLAEFGRSVHDVKDLLITHSHADHIGSAEELALKRRYEAPFIEEPPKDNDEPFSLYMARILAARNSGKFRPNLYVPHAYSQVLWGWSLRGGLAFSEEIDLGGPKGEMLMGHFFNLQPPKKLDGFGVDSWEQDIGGIKVQTFVTKHIPDATDRVTESMYSAGMVIDGRVYYSGDTKFDEATTMRFGEGCELLFHDCQHFPGGVHAFYGDLKRLPEDVRKKMLLYHLTDPMLNIDVQKDGGFMGFAEPAPVVYDFLD